MMMDDGWNAAGGGSGWNAACGGSEAIRRRLVEEERGEEARRILEHPLVIEAFAVLKDAYVTGWTATGARAVDDREAIWRHMQTLEKVQGHLKTVLETGRLARAQLRAIEGRRGLFG